MRAVIFSAAVLLAAGSARADAVYERCMQAAATTAAMGDCGTALVAREDARLNAEWKRVFPLLEGDARARLLDAQRAWIRFKDRSCTVYAARPPFGSLQGAVHAPRCRARVIAERTAQLRALREAVAGR